jgi:hypothetical protein
MVRAGVREGVAMAIRGYRTREIFERYNITSDEDLRQAVKQTAEHLSAQNDRAEKSFPSARTRTSKKPAQCGFRAALCRS